MTNKFISTQESQIIAGALSGRTLLAFIADRIAQNDVNALNVALEVTMRRPTRETSIFPEESRRQYEDHTYFMHAHSVWSAALVGSLKHHKRRPTGFAGEPEATSANVDLHVSAEMKDFFKRCSLKLIKHVVGDRVIDENFHLRVANSNTYGNDDEDCLYSAGHAVAFMAAMLNDVELYLAGEMLINPKNTRSYVLLELRDNNDKWTDEKHGLFTFRSKPLTDEEDKRNYFNQMKITPAFVALAFSSLDVFHEAIAYASSAHRLKIYSTGSGSSLLFTLPRFLELQQRPLEKGVLLDLLSGGSAHGSSTMDTRFFAKTLSNFVSNVLVPGFVDGAYKGAFEDVLKACPDIIREHAPSLFELSTYSCNPLVAASTIESIDIPSVTEGAWFPDDHPISRILESCHDCNTLGIEPEEVIIRNQMSEKIEPDAKLSDEVLFVVLSEMQRLGRLDEVLLARSPDTNDNLGHLVVAFDMDKSASFLCAKGIDHEAKNTSAETMLAQAEPLQRETLGAMARSYKAMQEANKIMNELLPGLGLK